jgi:hypothetical protein
MLIRPRRRLAGLQNVGLLGEGSYPACVSIQYTKIQNTGDQNPGDPKALLWECVLKEKSVGNHRKSLFLGGKTHGFPPDFCKDIGVVVAFRIPDVPGITSGLVYKTEVQAQGKQRWDMEDAWHLEMGNELQVWLSMTFHIFPQSFIMLYQDCSTWYSRSSCSSNLFHNSQFSCAIWNQNVNQNVCRRRSILQFGFVWK